MLIATPRRARSSVKDVAEYGTRFSECHLGAATAPHRLLQRRLREQLVKVAV
jgi:hypothetical protein